VLHDRGAGGRGADALGLIRLVRIAIVGAGVGAIAAAVHLKRARFDDVTIFEQSDGPGGTWWDNHYPGAECDVPSHLYSFSFKLHNWERSHANRDEILTYVHAVIDEFGLAPHFRFGTRVRSVAWDEERQEYELVTGDGESWRFELVISALGQLNHPRYPDWPGLDSFRGPKFHTARWEHDHDLTGKRVAVVGTGSTAAQVVPSLAAQVGHLSVFQRQPGWIVPRVSEPYGARQRALMEHQLARRFERARIYLSREPGVRQLDVQSKAQAKARAACLAFLEETVPDPELRSALTPDYPFRCKRPVRSSAFYPALARENVTLVPHAVTRVTETGVVDATGATHDIDVLVMATGFQPTKFLATLEVRGRDGRSIHDAWGEEPEAFLGIAYPAFPNFFMLYGPNTNSSTTSIIFVHECQARFIVKTLRRMVRRGATAVDVRPAFNDRYNRWLRRGLEGTAYEAPGCTNYYRAPTGRTVTNWPYTSVMYWALTKAGAAFSAGLTFTRPSGDGSGTVHGALQRSSRNLQTANARNLP
jgi:cation diffusion facilitator CzcD-associated flavoprotein CzcO